MQAGLSKCSQSFTGMMQKKAVDYMKINGYPILKFLDYDMKVARNYWVRGVPETFIIDKEGIAREKIIREEGMGQSWKL